MAENSNGEGSQSLIFLKDACVFTCFRKLMTTVERARSPQIQNRPLPLDSKAKLRLENSLSPAQRNYMSKYTLRFESSVNFEGPYTNNKEGYKVEIFVNPNMSQLPVILMMNPQFRHILVHFGTGRLFFPGIYDEKDWEAKPLSLTDLEYQIKKWASQLLPTDINQLFRDGIFPVNVEMWSLYTRPQKDNYFRAVDKSKWEQKR